MAETYEVVITPRAEKSLKKILTYLSERSTHKTAKKVKAGLLEEISKLEKHPESNGIVKEISDESMIYRRRIKWSYRIIFTIEETEKFVFVVEINHVKENPEKLKEIPK